MHPVMVIQSPSLSFGCIIEIINIQDYLKNNDIHTFHFVVLDGLLLS